MSKTLFVTPDYTSDVYQCRTLRTPNNLEWLGVFNKALLLMLDPYNWEQINDTDVTVDETIALTTTIIDEFWATETCGGGDGCMLPGLDSPPFRLGVNGRFEMLDPATGEWSAPTGEYEIPPTPERDEPTADERRCAAAANAANVMQQLYEAITDEIALGGDTLQVAAAMVAALVTAVGGWIAAPVYAIIQLSIALFAGMIELLQVLGGDVWTEDFNDKLKCALVNCATDAGDVVTFDLECIRGQLMVEPDILSPTWFYDLQLFAQVVFLMETITMDGLNAAGATTGITDADCEACLEWCYEWDTSDIAATWTQVGIGQGTYSNFVYLAFAELANVEHVEFEYTWNGLGGGSGSAEAIWASAPPVTEYRKVLIQPISGTGFVEWDGVEDWQGITVGANGQNFDTTATITITRIKAYGQGSSPVGGSNCDHP